MDSIPGSQFKITVRRESPGTWLTDMMRGLQRWGRMAKQVRELDFASRWAAGFREKSWQVNGEMMVQAR